ncbi:hypothetical protein CAI21_11290 [Alkalilimnicola ehrlichii]|uniref:Uncharacterized protein n=1 Tax=Alkalilimnicola ehrlichii TaxID=351052 RepID=A0A3E0X006_9GAMM|nr:hypothetical protein CAI21_11290 [Alkalilimnicola ehrlichii]RFA38659.1 hypothetical protein CAL65_04840 [Alkalilimnicola ehrlichii]
MPHFSAPSLFAAILDGENGGHFSLTPKRRVRVERRYRGDTAVLETLFVCETGTVRLTDCMPINTDPEGCPIQPQRELLRLVEVLDGEIDLTVDFQPRPEYAARRAELVKRGRLGWQYRYGNRLLVLASDVALEPSADGRGLHAEVRAKAGQRLHFSVCFTEGDVATFPLLGEAAEERVAATCHWWERWSRICRYQGPYRAQVVRSAITLKLLDYALSGAVLAAPTASLPENIGGSRNWDYRFCWLRDAAFTYRSFMDLGYTDEASAFLEWLLHSTRLTWPELQVLYAAHGEIDIDETELKQFSGYRGSRPVRIGNGAQDQLQLDVYGEVVLAAYDYVLSGGRLDPFERRMVAGLGHTVCRLWRKADEGIWEIRDIPRHYTYSKLMCWVALDRLLQLHEKGQLSIPVAKFYRERAALEQAINARGFNASLNSFVGAFDGDQADGSLLLMARRGFLDARDPRMVGTYDFIERELGRNGLIYRYHTDYDPLPEGEGAFWACSFWAVDCLIEQGRMDEARERFEHVAGFANELGLMAEELEPDSGLFCGNFPQAYSHLALIDAAMGMERRRVGREET